MDSSFAWISLRRMIIAGSVTSLIILFLKVHQNFHWESVVILQFFFFFGAGILNILISYYDDSLELVGFAKSE
jgi:hypothetical protein